MSRWILVAAALVLITAFTTTEARAQANRPTAIVSIYRIAPGQHLAFLEWVAAQDAAAREAGAPASTWYVHQDGDSWDYVGISAQNTPEVERKIDEVSRQRGLKTGFQSGLEFRRYVAYHTDTIAWGPTTIGEILAAAKQ